ncbi:response regulator [Patescibacteria group bacterium]|nr:response regulator [Patescibacteria group bacterium]MBU4512712.1 response regulator [Patescibacteria group bacterium]MCG2688429.1 response regulator [Candidatus Parcubacteria bacterium]MCG2693173.1 response regulator [Candidatus Parcubacteria bacterium]
MAKKQSAKEKPKILLVDDDDFFLKMYAHKFRIEGFRVLTAAGAEEGFKLLKKEKPSLAYVDIAMPKKDGFYFLKQAKGCGETADIPVILLTNLEGPEVRERGCHLGALYFVSKAEKLPSDLVRIANEVLVAQKVEPDDF